LVKIELPLALANG